MRLLHSALGLVMAAGGALVAVTPAAAGTTAVLPHAVGGFQVSTTRVDAAPRIGSFGVLPASASLATNLPPVGDQGQIGSCVAWTIAHSIMGYYAKRDGGSGAPYAPLYLYMRSVAKGGAPSAGLVPEKALAEATTNGVDTQDDYLQGTTNYSSAPTVAEIANAANYKVANWTTLWVGANQGAKAQTALQTAIAAGSPVAIGIPVYRDFMYLSGSALYKTTTGISLGGHMITAYGYDSEGIWVRNQWGTGWGASGDAHLAWSFVNTNILAAYTVTGVKTPAVATVPKPVVSTISAVRGPVTGGAPVVISGGNLAGVTAVKFGDTGATFKKVETNGITTLVATSPARPKGAVDVTVVNAGGISALNSQARFTYVPPAPVVTGLSVASASVLGGDTVTVTGTDFAEANAVRLGNAAGGTVKVAANGNSLTFVVPSTLTAGVYDVSVTTPYGTSPAVTADRLNIVNPPAPTITSLSVNSGPTYAITPVTINGTNFNGVKTVTLGGAGLVFQRVSETQLKVTMPIHAAGKVTLRVNTLGGSIEGTAAPFTYVAPPVPTVTSISPATGGVKVSTTVTLNGANVGTATKVTVNGVSVSFTKVSETALKVTLPPHAAGATSIQVTTPGGTSVAAPASTFTYKA